MIARLAPVLLLLASLAACAPKGGTGPGEAKALWEGFVNTPAGTAQSLALSASLSLQAPQKSARLLATFRGDLNLPLRLDLSTGMGQTFALWREDSLGWMAVYPLSNQVFTHRDTKAALAKLGIPFPFTLKDLAALTAGRHALITGASFVSARKTPKGYEFALPASQALGSVTLDFEGNPIHLSGRGVEPWSVELGDYAPPESGGGPLPRLIKVTSPGGLTAVLRVKRLELSDQRAEAQALDLAVPPKAQHIPLDRPGDFRPPDLP
ncbi:hypothetical protein NNJEOMEG_03365 [Fundidesulfovibrio magnetotacticus]|uniref:Outer-membrane lipoprotein LolB n=1 Tax=Fundidesulfovibrio magnetotacticus TaxID=2730080 RepID=A0A6V8LX80_9BACT|nr:hypothetical protein [Fundidesulfovibrio magnetotacticus]GFK95500.1 hypothetical protein NNJEOMEG_03365 [Fundidesulfovibrio magnetotacticus]